mmetsp:Transcript_3111/g.19170  ORF Transcript_3111/g.19170 Transcript_3111/m.19170 type:complete len:160 (-) Transcript_3111:248-727(-)
METALCYDSTRRRLRICARETFASDDHIALHVAAELDTKEGHVSARAKLRKRYFPKHLGFHVDVGAEYATDADEIRYGVKGRKKWELSEDGLLSLDFKSKVQFSQMKRKVRRGCETNRTQHKAVPIQHGRRKQPQLRRDAGRSDGRDEACREMRVLSWS